VSVLMINACFVPGFDETRKRVEADQVILAIGQACDLSFLDRLVPLP